MSVLFDFHFGQRTEPISTTTSPWAAAVTNPSELSSPFFSHDFGGAFTDLTNDMGWGRREGDAKGSCTEGVAVTSSHSSSLHDASPTAGVNSGRQDSVGGGVTTTDMLVRGDFLCASKLLQLAANSSGGMEQTFHTTRTSGTSATMDVRDDGLDSPSRESTPMSVANAVLYGCTDDSPPIDKYRLHQNERSAAIIQQREYSSFCVSAGESRDMTPVSPTRNQAAVDVFCGGAQQQSGANCFGALFTTQTQQQSQMQQHTPSASAVQHHHQHQRSSSVNSLSSPQNSQGHSSPSPTYFGSGQSHQPSMDSCARRAVRSHHVPTIVPVQKPTIVELAGPQTCVLVLEFKMGRKLRCRSDSTDFVANPNSAVGQYFIATVDSTGLEDAGVCTAVVPMAERHTLHRIFGHSDQATILRVADIEDCNCINDVLPEMEEAALLCCHDLIHFLHLPFVCVDAEYSFDKKGCKVFYALAPQACTSIVPNVSRLQRELSCKMKCKMVLEQVRQQN